LLLTDEPECNQVMPLLKLETTVTLTDEKRKTLLSSLSKVMADTTGKPEEYVMVTASQSAVLMSGQAGDAAFVDIRGIGGLSGDVNRQLSQKVCRLLNESLGVPPNRVYLNFTELEAGNWGWKGNTFG
jgi:phenylpyruvate tautomerase